MKLKFSFLLLSLFITEASFAACDYVLNVPPMNYNYGEINPSVSNTFRLTRNDINNGQRCLHFFVAPTAGWANNYNREAQNLQNGQKIYYNIYKNSNLTGVLKGVQHITSPDEAIIDTINGGQTKQYTYYFALSANNSNIPLRAGTYVDYVQFQTYSGTYTNIKGLEANVNLEVRINVAKYIAIALVNTGAAFDESKTSKVMDFGELTEGKEQSFDIRVVSNSGFTLSASSGNNGSLVRIGGSSTDIKSKIEYDFYANNNKIWLGSSSSSPVNLLGQYDPTPVGGTKVPVRVVIKNTTDKKPGTYQDYVTLSVVSTN